MHTLYTVILLTLIYVSFFPLLTFSILTEDDETIKVAVIGGGISGAALTYFLKQRPPFNETGQLDIPNTISLKGPPFEVHLYEQNSHLGGRLRDQIVGGMRYEAGGSVIHSSNRYIKYFIEHVTNMTLTDEGFGNSNSSSTPGILAMWDGNDILFEVDFSNSSRITVEWEKRFGHLCAYIPTCTYALLRIFSGAMLAVNKTVKIFPLLNRYGTYVIWKLRRVISDIVFKWENIYNTRKGPYTSVGDLANGIGVAHMMQQTAVDYFKENNSWIGDNFFKEILSSINRANYGQDEYINAFAATVSLAGFAIVGGLHSTAEGNSEIPTRLINKNADKIFMQSKVIKVEKSIAIGDSFSPKFTLHYRDLNRAAHDDTYDVVVIAAPLELLTADIHDAIDDYENVVERTRTKFQITICTFVVAAGIRASYFNLTNRLDDSLYDIQVMLTPEYADSNMPFSSLSRLRVIDSRVNVYKLSSRRDISDDVLNDIFVNVTEVQRRNWRAYPILSPQPHDRFPFFSLSRGVYYTNAMEILASTIETQCIASRNVADLIITDLQYRKDNNAQENIRLREQKNWPRWHNSEDL